MTASVDLSTCPVCATAGGHDSDLGGILRRCGTCTLRWTHGEPLPPDELYDDAYFQGEGYQDYFQPAARRHEAGLRVRWLLSTGRPTSLVEVGSAGGFFVEAAGRAGIAAEGVDVSAAAVGYARSELGITLRQGRFESMMFPQTVEAVCAFHVLEHVDDPNEFLTAARRALMPGGRLAIEVPNVSSVAARRLGLAWPGLQPRYHRWHFTPESLTRLVTAHGFRVLRRDTAVFRFYLPPPYRRRHAHHLLPADLRNLRSLRLTHPHRGDLLRLIAIDGRGRT
jgi:SAM-dependent methyltransferase